jgi:hypothetical protein
MNLKSYFLYSVTLCLFYFGNAQITAQKIPFDGKRWYQLTNASKDLHELFDGDTHTEINTGNGKIIKEYDAYYALLPGEKINIESIRLFDGKGINNIPTIIYAIDSNWKRWPIATFTGSQYNEWVGPNPLKPNQFKIETAVKNIQYLMIHVGDILPTEIEIYGQYKQPNPNTPLEKKFNKLSNFFGVNAYEWDFENAQTPQQIDESKWRSIKNFTGIRHYLDWEKLEEKSGSYTYNPTRDGGWNYDAIYQRCKTEGITVLACIKTIPHWLQETYPENLRDNENVPAPYGSNLAIPQSYILQAKLAFQFIARYGSNTKINPALLKVNVTPRWTADPINAIKIGMNLIKYIECDNERDKWWKGRKGYQTAREYAANLSTFYDGHLNTMGPGVGVKNADKNVLVVMGGIALANTDYIKGMIDWCKEFRGYKPDGSINVCWDIINYHLYTNDTRLKRGIAPEKGTIEVNATAITKSFINLSHQYLNDMPVWVTEAGYDVHPSSPNKAISIAHKTTLQTQADWILRTSLLYERCGIQKVFFYQLHDDHPDYGGLYATSGLINTDGKNRPAADYLFQTNKLFGNYMFTKSLNVDPVVDEYKDDKGNIMYAIYIPDEKNRTGNYELNLGKKEDAFIYTPTMGATTMKVEKLKTHNGNVNIKATETPIFVIGK